MENEKKGSKVAVVSNVLLIIFAIIICFMAFYINRLLTIQNSLECLSKDQSAMIEQINNDQNGEIKTEEKSSYETFMENYKKERTKETSYDAFVYEYLGDDYRKYELPGIIEIKLDNKGNLHLGFSEEFLKGKGNEYSLKDYILEKDVFTFRVCPVGNGGYSDLIILKMDGTAEKLSGVKFDQTGKLDLEKLEIKNVIHIDVYSNQDPEGGGSMGYKLFSIDGTTLSD